MATMLPSKSKSGLSEASNNKERPATPRVSKVGRAGSLKSEPNSPSPTQNPRHSIDRSPRSVDSKPTVDRRSPKTSSTPEKPTRLLKGSELQSQLNAAQEELKKAKEQLASVEKEKSRIVEELNHAKKSADEANEQLQEALLAKKNAEEATEIEKFRAIELEQVGIDVAQKREDEWQKELESIKNQHKMDIEALVFTSEELEKLRKELVMTIDAKSAALSHADEAMKIAEANAEKADLLSQEVGSLKAFLDSNLESKANESDELVKKLELEIAELKSELEEARAVEEKLVRMEALIEELKTEAFEAKNAESEADRLADEWKKNTELLEVQLEEANKSEMANKDSLASAMEQLEEKIAFLEEKESEIASLKGKIEALELEVAGKKTDLDESKQRFDELQQQVFEFETTVEILKNKVQISEEEKVEALNNGKVASSKIESLEEERNKLVSELAATKDEGEKAKMAMEDLTSALHEVSAEFREAQEKFLGKEAEVEYAKAQIGDLKLALNNTKESYEVMLDEANYEIVCLRKTIERLETEAKSHREELDSKELNFASSNKQSEEAIVALKAEIDKAMEVVRSAENEAQAAKEEKTEILNKLKQVESAANEAKRAVEEAKAESLQLKERLLDKENELQNITQENDELHIQQKAALEKIDELSAVLAESKAKSPKEESRDQSNGEKSVEVEDPNGFARDERRQQEEDKNSNDEQAEPVKVMEKDLATEKEQDDELVDDELESKMDEGSFDQTNGSTAENSIGNGASSPTKQQQLQKKKKPLLHKFGSLLKKKNNQK
ncbi:WEB family protein At5g16730, chloroplastic-like [Ananas comosus]|uniref:WEB family protein At5g16730, chloroplastic-like n=2 Tax=Ananas comosus TaxID=4615 RepID=A0A6P5FEZ9_ANACO|nr:WEB family protein At5g16730, chloroplastic-like [Ananas comosus]